MKKVKDILSAKGKGVWSVSPDSSVYDSAKLMAEKHISAVMVMEQDKLAGIVTERDYSRKVVASNIPSKDLSVRDIMTDKVLCVDLDKTVDECMVLMSEKGARHLPVVDNDEVIGIVSIRDLVQAVISDQKELIDQLQSYISG